jgi:hypothetical protein
MKYLLRSPLALLLLLVATHPAFAVSADECEQQRALYPKDWNDVAHERALFTCTAHYANPLRVMIGETDQHGRTLMSLVPLNNRDTAKAKQDTSKDVYRIWLDVEQLRRLKDGHYFATIVRQQSSCWIRGSLDAGNDGYDSVFFMDNAGDHPDDPDKAGSFYNKAPRFSVFQDDAYTCTPVK